MLGVVDLLRRAVEIDEPRAPDMADTDLLLQKIEAALQGGINILQYRNKAASHKLQTQQA